jgi:hypothetical protein
MNRIPIMDSQTHKRLAIQLATQLPEEPADQQLVLMFLHELLEWLNDAPARSRSERHRQRSIAAQTQPARAVAMPV